MQIYIDNRHEWTTQAHALDGTPSYCLLFTGFSRQMAENHEVLVQDVIAGSLQSWEGVLVMRNQRCDGVKATDLCNNNVVSECNGVVGHAKINDSQRLARW